MLKSHLLHFISIPVFSTGRHKVALLLAYCTILDQERYHCRPLYLEKRIDYRGQWNGIIKRMRGTRDNGAWNCWRQSVNDVKDTPSRVPNGSNVIHKSESIAHANANVITNIDPHETRVPFVPLFFLTAVP
jgi:hypothetical protein